MPLAKITIRTSVEKGQFKRNRNMVLDAIRSFEGKDCNFTIEPIKKKRSNNQNAYYWSVVVGMVQQGIKDAFGETRTPELIHYGILLPMFAPVRTLVNEDTAECISERMSSSEMSTTQMMEYVMEIQRWAAITLGIDIPDPNQEIEMNFEQ